MVRVAAAASLLPVSSKPQGPFILHAHAPVPMLESIIVHPIRKLYSLLRATHQSLLQPKRIHHVCRSRLLRPCSCRAQLEQGPRSRVLCQLAGAAITMFQLSPYRSYYEMIVTVMFRIRGCASSTLINDEIGVLVIDCRAYYVVQGFR